jgi:hypothetical protein
MLNAKEGLSKAQSGEIIEFRIFGPMTEFLYDEIAVFKFSEICTEMLFAESHSVQTFWNFAPNPCMIHYNEGQGFLKTHTISVR